jgi:hypothetical protein
VVRDIFYTDKLTMVIARSLQQVDYRQKGNYLNNKLFLASIELLLAMMLVSCQGITSPSTAETLQVPQTVEYTEIVQPTAQKMESEAVATVTKTAVTSLSFPVQPGTSSVEVDPAYFDGFIVLTQYYTLLDHGFYQESYRMLSSSQKKRYSFEDYTNFYTHDLKAIKIIGIQPYNYWRSLQELPALPAPPNELRFIVFSIAYHHGAAWNIGGTPKPHNVTGFESLVLENNEWKVDEFNTMPWADSDSVELPVTKNTVIPPLSSDDQVLSPSIDLDPAYFDGIIVLTKYYTLLDHGLYEEVLPLYSSSLLKRTDGKNFEVDLKSVKLISIHPYPYWCAQSGWPLLPIPENQIRYIVGTIVFHKAAAWNVGGTPEPDNQTSFISLIFENDEWKIYDFNSSP